MTQSFLGLSANYMTVIWQLKDWSLAIWNTCVPLLYIQFSEQVSVGSRSKLNFPQE